MFNGHEEKKTMCLFCQPQSKIIDRNEEVIAIPDKYPITEGHTLIVPVRHVQSFFDLYSNEVIACFALINKMKERLVKKDSSISGFNIGINDGIDAGQTIFHCHIHVIPRRKGDVANPRGGVRNIIPQSGNY